MAVDHLLAYYIIVLIFKTGSTAADTVFVKTGDSVQLDIQTHELSNIQVLSWEKDNLDIITYICLNQKLVKDNSYQDRVNFNTETFSLTLKNMQKTDSGLYTARQQIPRYEDVASFRVSVIDEVKVPDLTVVSNQSSSDSCTVNFTCRGHELTLNSTYQNNRCSEDKHTSGIFTLHLICSEESIICNHSNPVSWKTDRTDIKQLCVGNETPAYFIPGQSESFVLLTTVMLVAVLGVIGFWVLVVYCCCRNKKGVQDDEDYDDAETLFQIHEVSDDTWTTIIYNTVGQHHKPAAKD